MVWKRLTVGCLICALAVMLALPATASAAELPQLFMDGLTAEASWASYPSDVIVWAEGILSHANWDDDYLLFSMSDGYALIVGSIDFVCEDLMYPCFGLFQCSFSRIFVYEYSYFDDNIVPGFGCLDYLSVIDLTVSVEGQLVFSNVGMFPTLIDQSTQISFSVLLALSVITLVLLIRPVFSFINRRSST